MGFLQAVDKSFSLLKGIHPADSSKVDPLSVPVAGKVGLSMASSFRIADLGLGCLEEKDIPIRPPESDLPSKFIHHRRLNQKEDVK